jgi:hypothetical protein
MRCWRRGADPDGSRRSLAHSPAVASRRGCRTNRSITGTLISRGTTVLSRTRLAPHGGTRASFRLNSGFSVPPFGPQPLPRRLSDSLRQERQPELAAPRCRDGRAGQVAVVLRLKRAFADVSEVPTVIAVTGAPLHGARKLREPFGGVHPERSEYPRPLVRGGDPDARTWNPPGWLRQFAAAKRREAKPAPSRSPRIATAAAAPD